MKPVRGCGGRGARRFDRVARRSWSEDGRLFDDSQLIAELRASGRPLIVQQLVRPHPTLAPLTTGALPTVRALT